ncbi:Tabersonine 16-hydroxylase [Gossypium australe]|uniref:Tabersonine 16-hydroxylase n=1 Tax=Gossypium australe TaxID=47621 RepID=A0A5B6WQQ3_9ROSI|nr:Tabersonine 16-hydroxylase [Gossypium australe]
MPNLLSSICSCIFRNAKSAIFDLLLQLQECQIYYLRSAPATSGMPNCYLRSAPASSRMPDLLSSICSCNFRNAKYAIFDLLLQLQECQICYLRSAPATSGMPNLLSSEDFNLQSAPLPSLGNKI